MTWQKNNSVPTSDKVLTRREYQEILLARMAGGDLYANELRLRIRKVDMMLDRLRIACGTKPLYGETKG
ncbi:MAG: hypothetical protein IJA95_06590 [Bacteroidaceae bacterium]|nr:hypothetical protein [Bacteroidaceae bacterium]